MAKSILHRSEIHENVSEAYKQWEMEREKMFISIDQHIEMMSKGSSPVAKKLTGGIPDDVWNEEMKEKQLAKDQVGNESAALSFIHDEDCLEQKKCMVFGKEFYVDSVSDLAKIKEEVATIYDKDTIIADGFKLAEEGELSSLKDYFANRIKLFLACSAYADCIALLHPIVIWIGKMVLSIARRLRPLPKYEYFDEFQDGPKKLLFITNQFENWGETVKKTPTYTFFPKTTAGLCNVVKFAKKEGKRIRISGFRHSWTDLWADNDQIQVAMLPLQITDKLNFMIDLVDKNEPGKPFHVIYDNGEWDDSEFVKIDDPQPEYIDKDGKTYAHVRVGSAVCGLQILEWIFDRHKSGKKGYQLPLDVIMSLNTYGGKLSTMSHGAGLNHPTLADLVVGIEYVDANGKHQAIDDPRLLKAAAGSIGMLGILTHITFRMEARTFALFQPISVELEKAIPPPDDTSSESYIQMLSDVKSSYYCEWFWMYGNKKVYKNTWQDNGKEDDYEGPMIDKLEHEYQRMCSYLMGILQAFILTLHEFCFKDFIIKCLQWMVPKFAMFTLVKPKNPLTVLVFEALHFRRGINYLPVRCMEFLIPIPKNAEGEADFRIVQQAWWDVHKLLKSNEYREFSPMNLTMEVRVLSASEIYLAPEYGNEQGTCSIEVLGTMLAPKESWEDFKNKVAEIWSSYKDRNGNQLNVRPHWGKEFPQKFGEKSCNEFLQDRYRESFKKFKTAIEEIATKHDFTIAEMRNRFSNVFLENLFEPLW